MIFVIGKSLILPHGTDLARTISSTAEQLSHLSMAAQIASLLWLNQ